MAQLGRLIRYKPDRAGMRDLLRAPFIDDMLFDRASNVADVARSDYDANPPHSGEVEVDVINDSDSDRARVAVITSHPAALAIEADRGVLRSAINAAGLKFTSRAVILRKRAKRRRG